MKRWSVVLVVIALSCALLNQGQQSPAQSQKPATGHHADMHKQMSDMNKMMVAHLGKQDANYEKRFIDMMIPHHEGAIMMAEHALKHANEPALKEKAEKMIAEQKKEIEELKKWRSDWYGAKGTKESAR